ncbi:MAG TPA: DNA polymerase III subunit delta' [Pyrinomonadaceae bacterium]|nr:DNA polymerase III subunit delta' [Pyrinomonadaceae bacterium]
MFSRLIGNLQAKSTLKRLIANGRLPNSLLLAGPEGVGKREFALETARTLLCPEKNGDEACGVCRVCTRIAEFVIPTTPTDSNKDQFKKIFFGGHGDVAIVVPYKNFILVDAIRDLEQEANYRPFEASMRFFIIDDADKMNDQAANALLKTLEEPPSTTYIFLITSRPDSLLPTIRSRCQTLRFAPVGTQEIEDYLTKERAMQHHEAALAARLSRGSLGRAVHLDVEKFRVSRQRMFEALRHAVSTGDRTALLKIVDKVGVHDAAVIAARGERP